MNKEFQRALLQSLTQDPSLLPLLPQIQSKVFDLVEDQVYLELLNEYVKKFRTLPSKAEMGEYLDQNLVNKGVPTDVVKLIVSSLHNAFMPIQGEMDFVKGYLYGEIMGKKSTTLLKDFMARMKDTPITEMPGLIDWVVGEFGDIRRFGGGAGVNNEQVRSGGFLTDAVIKPEIPGHPTVFPTLNRMMSAGGFHTPELILLLSAPKSFKTGTMIELGLGFMKDGLKGYYADTENGEWSIRGRMEQNLLRCTKEELKDPDVYGNINEVTRWATAMKGNMMVDSYVAYRATPGDVRMRLDQLKRDYGYVPDFIVWDSIDHFIPTDPNSRRKDERLKIKEVFFEVIAINKDYELFSLAPSQVNRAAVDKKVFSMKDFAEDFSKAGNVHAAFAICRTPEEIEAGIARIIPVVQREGVRYSANNVCVVEMDESIGLVREIDIDQAEQRINQVSYCDD